MVINSQYSINYLNYLKNYRDDIPNIRILLSSYLHSIKDGISLEGLSNNEKQRKIKLSKSFCKRDKKISRKVIERIKEKGIITNDNDLLFTLIRDIERISSENEDISEDEIMFISKIGQLYLKIRESSYDTTIKYNCSLMELYEIRNRLLLSGKKINDVVLRMFDYIDISFIKENSQKRTKRYNQDNVKNYYKIGEEKEIVGKIIQDIRPYIDPSKGKRMLRTGINKLTPLSAQIYSQAFLMLEYDMSFDKVLRFIKSATDNEQAKKIIIEIIRYSRKGKEFFEFFYDSKKTEKRSIRQIKRRKRYEERAKKRIGVKPGYFDYPYDDEEFENDMGEKRYIEYHNNQFNLVDMLLNHENSKGIIVIAGSEIISLGNIDNSKVAIIKLCNYLSKNKTKIPSSQEGIDKSIDSYSNMFGYIIIDIANESSRYTIKTHIPNELSNTQKSKLRDVAQNFSNVKLLSTIKLRDPNRKDNFEQIDTFIDEVRRKTKPKEVKKRVLDWFKKQKNRNSQ